MVHSPGRFDQKKKGKEKPVSWYRSRFSQWEVEGEVRQRVGEALEESERARMAHQCQDASEWSATARVVCWLKAGAAMLAVRWESWTRALQMLKKELDRPEAQGRNADVGKV
jgi:hypothetical protein